MLSLLTRYASAAPDSRGDVRRPGKMCSRQLGSSLNWPSEIEQEKPHSAQLPPFLSHFAHDFHLVE